jgi:hypothetical protein
MTNRVVSSLLFSALLVLAIGITAPSAVGQRTSGAAGLGGQVGDPSGVTFKIYNAGAPSYDFLGAWSSVNDFFFLNAHVLFEEPIDADNVDQPLEWFIGPGGFIGTFEGGGPFEGEAVLGISGTVGLQMELADHFELHVQATPRFALIPETEGDIGGGLGLRYYF